MSVTSVRVDTSYSDKTPHFLPVHDSSSTSCTLLSGGTLFLSSHRFWTSVQTVDTVTAVWPCFLCSILVVFTETLRQRRLQSTAPVSNDGWWMQKWNECERKRSRRMVTQNRPLPFPHFSDSLRAERSEDRIPVGEGFSAPVQTGSEAHPVSYTVGTGSFPGVKRLRRGVEYPPPSSAEVKERVQLYLYSPFRPSWTVIGWSLPLPLPLSSHLLGQTDANRDITQGLRSSGWDLNSWQVKYEEGLLSVRPWRRMCSEYLLFG